jgi:uncharacterized membrane protein YcaP (DUF421 family)
MEIIVRAAVIFFALFIILRAMGKRELAELTAFEFLMLIVIGDLVQPGIMQEDMSITGALLAVATITCCVMALSYVSFRWPRARDILEGHPVIVVRDGRVLDEALRIERVPVDELLAAARERGIDDLGAVRYAILEADGKFSFIPSRDDAPRDRRQ